eukprot:6094588-Heterocapsa_arctica.AAC.1
MSSRIADATVTLPPARSATLSAVPQPDHGLPFLSRRDMPMPDLTPYGAHDPMAFHASGAQHGALMGTPPARPAAPAW